MIATETCLCGNPMFQEDDCCENCQEALNPRKAGGVVGAKPSGVGRAVGAVGHTTWTPIATDGATFYLCRVEMYGHTATGTSLSKPKALSYALEELAALVHKTGTPDP